MASWDVVRMQDERMGNMSEQGDQAGTPIAAAVAEPGVSATASEDGFAALGDVDFLDDIDFSLEDVESRIAPLALAYR